MHPHVREELPTPGQDRPYDGINYVCMNGKVQSVPIVESSCAPPTLESGGNLKYILCVNTDLCYTQTYNGRKKRLVICVGRPAVMPKLIPQTCTDLCFAQICRIQNRIRQICAKRRLDTQIFFYRSSTAKIPVELQTGRLLSNSP
jgi:hypothetical protein